jgi:hypothetical protein
MSPPPPPDWRLASRDASSGLCMGHRTALAHLDGESFGPLGDHQVRAGIWGYQRLLLAATRMYT